MAEIIKITEAINKVIINSQGVQGPRGRGILNGAGAPASNLGLEGDFYLNTVTNEFFGPKLNDLSWDGAQRIDIATTSDLGMTFEWEMAQIQNPDQDHMNVYWIEIPHNLGFYPNVTIKNSAHDVLETGIDYNSINKITLTMAQPFGGTAYLS
jgi:hypothetical protein